jgi:hypothetical protein
MLPILCLALAGCGSAAAGTMAGPPISTSPSPLPAATFAERAGWASTASSDPGQPATAETFTTESTIPFRDTPFSAPPTDTLAAMAPDDVLIEVFLWRPGPNDGPITDRPAIDLPAVLDGGAAGQDFPGSDQSRWLQRLGGRVGDRMIDIWVFAGRPHPTVAQIASAQAMLDTLQLPAWPPG